MSKISFILSISLLLLVLFANANNVEIAKKKLALLKDMSAHNNIIELNPLNFKRFILNGSRYYIIILLITSQDSDCVFCKRFNSVFEEVYTAYNKKYRNSREIFFAKVDFKDIEQYFQDIKYKFELPTLFIVPPTEDEQESFNFLKGPSLKIKRNFDAGDVSYWINYHLELEIEAGNDPSEFVAIGVTIILFVLVIYTMWEQIIKWWKNPMAWFGLFLFEYVIVMSGTVYCFLHGSPLFVPRYDGIIWMHPSSQSQLGLEGIISGLLWTAVGVLWTVMTEVSHYKSQSVSKKLSALCFLILSLALYISVKLYKLKTPYYPFNI